MAEDLRRMRIEVHITPLRWWIGVEGSEVEMAAECFRDLNARVDSLRQLIDSGGFQAVLSNTAVIVEGALAAAQCRVPHVWHVLEHLAEDPGLRPPLRLGTFSWLMDRLSSRIVAVSQSVMKEIRTNCPTSDCTVIHTGVERLDRDRFRGSKRELFDVSDAAPVAIFVGELSRRKNVLGLVEAIPRIVQLVPGAFVAVVGPDRGELGKAQRMAETLGVQSHVRFLGARDDALRLIASADVLVLPSLIDPFPVVVLEAMALGTPVVARDSGGIAEMLSDGESGVLVRSGSGIELGNALAQLLSDEAARVRIGQAAQILARERFTPDRTAKSFENVLERLVLKRGGGGRTIRRKLLAMLLIRGWRHRPSRTATGTDRILDALAALEAGRKRPRANHLGSPDRLE